jgi:hypothetical protein
VDFGLNAGGKTMMIRAIALATVLAAMGGCAAGNANRHATMRGTVVMKVDGVDAHVCLEKDEIAVSDSVRLYRDVCTLTPKRLKSCWKQTLATGKVKQLLDDHYSVVTFPAGTNFAEGDKVEKIR